MNRRNLLMSLAVSALFAQGWAVAEDAKIVKIGVAGPLTGQVANIGKDLENGVRLAVEEANAKKLVIGGVPVQFQLVSEDDAADPRTATQVAQRLVDAGVVGVVGHYNSGCSIPASAVYHSANVAQITGTSTNPKLTMQGFDNVFRTMGHDAIGGSYAGKFAVQDLHAKRIAVLDDRTAFGQGLADEFEKAAKAAGGNVIAHEFTNDKATDFNAILTSIKARNADVLFFGGLDVQAAMIAKQMHQLSMKSQLLGGGAFKSNEFLSISGADGEGTLDLEPGPALDKLASAKRFAANYKARFKQDVELYAPFAYDAANALIEAMKKANSIDRVKIVKTLPTVNFPGVTGTITFDAKGDLKNPPFTLYEVKNGQWRSLRTVGGGA